jgi:hypothetical protein
VEPLPPLREEKEDLLAMRRTMEMDWINYLSNSIEATTSINRPRRVLGKEACKHNKD